MSFILIYFIIFIKNTVSFIYIYRSSLHTICLIVLLIPQRKYSSFTKEKYYSSGILQTSHPAIFSLELLLYELFLSRAYKAEIGQHLHRWIEAILHLVISDESTIPFFRWCQLFPAVFPESLLIYSNFH